MLNSLTFNIIKLYLEPDIDKSFLDKVLHSAERKLKKIVSKYSTLNKEVEKVYIIIKSYVSVPFNFYNSPSLHHILVYKKVL